MKTGIIGAALSGKTTIFNAISGTNEAVGTGSRDTHIANVKVPDARINKLSEVYQPKKTIYAEFDFVDFGGAFDSKLNPQILQKIRETDCLALVIGAYQNEKEEQTLKELNSILDEMILIDLLTVDKRLERLIKENKKDLEFNTLKKCKSVLENEGFINEIEMSQEEDKSISQFRLLTLIPIIVLINVKEDDFNKINYKTIEEVCKLKKLDFMYISGNIEMEISSLPESEQTDFLKDMGLETGAGDRFIRKAYEKMNLISFFTTGKDEVKAWTIRANTNAQKAAGKIHTDIERGFIRAEVVSYSDFISFGCDESKVKSAGKYRLEGKTYEVKDGDIIEFRFNV